MPPTEWFKDWFNTPYYNLLYKHRNENEAEILINNLLDFWKPAPESSFLDVACGKGRHARYLASKGVTVVGIDLSETSIAYARQFEHDRLHFFIQDMREPFAEHCFNYALNLFTSFGYFDSDEGNKKTLQAIYEALLPDAYLLIDFMNTHKVIANLVPQETKIEGDIHFHITRQLKNNQIIKNIVVNDSGQYFDYVEKVQALTLPDFQKLLHEQHFTICRLWGNYNLDPFDPIQSDRLLVLAQKIGA